MMQQEIVHVQVHLHRGDPIADVCFIVPVIIELDREADDWNIDEILTHACERAKNLVRPFCNNQTYIEADTPSIPMELNG